MNKPTISMIAALSENRVIGKDNKLLWHIPEDFKRFKTITSGHPIIMGRKTYQSIGKPLPNRSNIVVTRDKYFRAEGCIIVNSLEEGIEKAKKVESSNPTGEIFIIGGGELYKQGMNFADKLYLTIVHQAFEGDTFFPEYDEFKTVVYEQNSEGNGYKYSFIDLIR